eukprot:TRINITY_DN652_c0_g1_i6.p2 TRINITY_DN652_c0_g1~~TRINITY_DN652_c0_g1_i6.p2  ORF type:complete len:802 (-),score=259.50 TRINITY_DN652_c0_g1_i6:3066-5471(-)
MSEYNREVEETLECPLCLDELDLTDRSFKPCKCGYQMCGFCWNQINDNHGKCPACRQPYKKENFKFTPPNQEEIQRMNNAKKAKERERKQAEANARKKLANVRVIQRNLVYVTNLSLNSATEETLRQTNYFGRFGKIKKIVVNKHNIYQGPQGPSVSAYITYDGVKEALAAIKSADGLILDGRTLRASFGTTKYCTYFLRGMRCPNPDCMYLHELGNDSDSYTKEDMAQGKHLLSNLALNIEGEEETSRGEDNDQLSGETKPKKTVPAWKTLSKSAEIPVSTVSSSALSVSASASVSTSSASSAASSTTTATSASSSNQQSNLNLEEWPDAFSARNKPPKKKPTTKQDDLHNSQSKASALPATASWASKATHTSSSSEELSEDKKSRTLTHSGHVVVNGKKMPNHLSLSSPQPSRNSAQQSRKYEESEGDGEVDDDNDDEDEDEDANDDDEEGDDEDQDNDDDDDGDDDDNNDEEDNDNDEDVDSDINPNDSASTGTVEEQSETSPETNPLRHARRPNNKRPGEWRMIQGKMSSTKGVSADRYEDVQSDDETNYEEQETESREVPVIQVKQEESSSSSTPFQQQQQHLNYARNPAQQIFTHQPQPQPQQNFVKAVEQPFEDWLRSKFMDLLLDSSSEGQTSFHTSTMLFKSPSFLPVFASSPATSRFDFAKDDIKEEEYHDTLGGSSRSSLHNSQPAPFSSNSASNHQQFLRASLDVNSKVKFTSMSFGENIGGSYDRYKVTDEEELYSSLASATGANYGNMQFNYSQQYARLQQQQQLLQQQQQQQQQQQPPGESTYSKK